MNGYSYEEVAARGTNRAVTAFLFVSKERVPIDEQTLEHHGHRISAEGDDPSRIVFPIQTHDHIKNAADIITSDKIQDTLHRLSVRAGKYEGLRNQRSSILVDMEENLVFGERLLRELHEVPQRFSVAFDLSGEPIEEQIGEKIPFVKLDQSLRDVHRAATSVGGCLQGVKVIHTTMSEMADDIRRKFGIGHNFEWYKSNVIKNSGELGPIVVGPEKCH